MTTGRAPPGSLIANWLDTCTETVLDAWITPELRWLSDDTWPQ